MKITKRQLRRIIRESGRDWDLEDNVSYFIAAGPPEKAIKYLEKLVAHAEAGGEVGWRDAMNSHDPEIANFEYAKKRLEALKSGADGAIGHSRLPENAISKRRLKQIIKEEKAKILKEGWNSADPLSPLIQFGDAWMSLGTAVADQIIDLSNAHIEGRIEDAVYEMNPNALDVAFERLQRPLSALSADGDENAAELMDAMEAAAEIFAEGDAEVDADAYAAGDY